MELLENQCHWCEIRITRPSENLLWICDYESADCEFHPSAWDSVTLKPTNKSAPHQTTAEVENIIRAHYELSVLQRDKSKRLRAVDSNTVSTSKWGHGTSRNAAARILPSTGTMRRIIYDTIKANNDYGYTDYELETVLGGKHQTLSALRRSLVIDGWVLDSGKTRQNPQGNDCIVWVEKDEMFSEMLFNVK
tara:strand:+ start:513 stop:1088 length:576 start_codon:yes stop_codon:yes gene_type:complete